MSVDDIARQIGCTIGLVSMVSGSRSILEYHMRAKPIAEIRRLIEQHERIVLGLRAELDRRKHTQ